MLILSDLYILVALLFKIFLKIFTKRSGSKEKSRTFALPFEKRTAVKA